LCTAEDEDDEDDSFPQIAQHIARRGAASNGRAYVSLDKALAKIAGAEIMVTSREKKYASQGI
jgi:hypothetical protein